MQGLAAFDPQKAMEVAQKLPEAQNQAATDLEGACKNYDKMFANWTSSS